MSEEFDYVIVGGGSAGLPLASRLSEDGRHTVALIEAGGEADAFMVRMPAGFARLLNDPTADWCYMQERDPSILDRRFVWSAGKLLGGSSSINGQVYIRGSVADHQRWVDMGAAGWGFYDCLPYFKRSESFAGPDEANHGHSGPLRVERLRDHHRLVETFLKACAERGVRTLDEYCGGDMDGAFESLATQRSGWRCGTAQAFLPQARKRPNFKVFTRATAESVVFDGRRAVGVRFVQDGVSRTISARAEVIVSASAVGSPALLMRSGVGPAAALKALGIAVVADRDGVGANLQEHPTVPVNKFVNVPTYNSQMGRVQMMRHAANFYFRKMGPMVTPAVQAMACARTRPDVEQPDVQLHFLPLAYDIEPETTCASTGSMPKEPTAMISASASQPKSRGRVRLKSALCADKPIIDHQLLGDRRDVDTLVGACKLIEAIFAAPAWKGVLVGPRDPPAPYADDAHWEQHVRSHTTIAYHPVGTCRIGAEADVDAVVDPQLRVFGTEALRVADASVLPTITSANTNATAIMVGERAADFVRAAARL